MATWLEQVNAYRALANLPPVTEDPALSEADRNLAEFEARNLPALSHDLSSYPNATAAVRIAASQSSLAGSSDPSFSDDQALHDWMSDVFHGMGFIDPRLKTVGFGSFHTTDNTPTYKTVAAINQIGGLDFNMPPQYPVMWPADGKTSPFTTYSNEYPDARSQCGYQQPAGQPIFLLLGQGYVGSQLTCQLVLNGTRVPACEMDGSNYTTWPSESSWQGVARNILDGRGAIVLLPKDPLANGTYTVVITNAGYYGPVMGQVPPPGFNPRSPPWNSFTYAWKFSVDSAVAWPP